jgi:hypothetical protein
MRFTATAVCLWIAVITVATSVGGNVFQSVVVDPIWSGAPPDSVRAFARSSLPTAIARFHLNPLFAIGLLCLLASPALAWNLPALRTWLLVAVAVQAVIVAGTLLYFHPINDVLLSSTDGVDGATITALTRRWLVADRLRIALRFVALLSLLRAMTLFGKIR